jgi:hypothetical protein
MPSTTQILQNLAQIANAQRPAAILWHIALFVLVVALALGFRPRLHQARVALAAPIASVSVFAWSYANPFNGAVFGAFAAVLAILGTRAPSELRVARGPLLPSAAGVLMIASGWVYPHFVEVDRWWHFLYEAPLGLLPCPTLSVLIGLALLGGGLGSSAWASAVSLLGLFYGVFGAWYLGVSADWVLCAGSAFLAFEALRLNRRNESRADR